MKCSCEFDEAGSDRSKGKPRSWVLQALQQRGDDPWLMPQARLGQCLATRLHIETSEDAKEVLGTTRCTTIPTRTVKMPHRWTSEDSMSQVAETCLEGPTQYLWQPARCLLMKAPFNGHTRLASMSVRARKRLQPQTQALSHGRTSAKGRMISIPSCDATTSDPQENPWRYRTYHYQ